MHTSSHQSLGSSRRRSQVRGIIFLYFFERTFSPRISLYFRIMFRSLYFAFPVFCAPSLFFILFLIFKFIAPFSPVLSRCLSYFVYFLLVFRTDCLAPIYFLVHPSNKFGTSLSLLSNYSFFLLFYYANFCQGSQSESTPKYLCLLQGNFLG